MIPLRGALTTLGSFLLHLSLGTGNTFGNMSPYIMSYIRYFGNNTNDSVHDVVWIYSMICVGHGLFLGVGGIIGTKIGPRVTTFIGCVLMSAGVATSYFTIKSSLTLLTLTYGALSGIGIGTAYAAPLFAGMMWFPDNKGLVNGIIISGFGLSSFIFTQMQTFYINPDNSLPNEDGYFTDVHMLERVPKIFLYLGATYITMQIIGCLLLSYPKDKESTKEDISMNEMQSMCESSLCTHRQYDSLMQCTSISRSVDSPELRPPCLHEQRLIESNRCYSPTQILRHRQFYILWVSFFLNNMITFYIASTYKVYGQTFIKDDKYLAMIGAIGAIFNSAGRLVWGYICDRYNFKFCMLALTSSACAFIGTLSMTPFGGKAMFTVWVWLIYFIVAGNFVLFPTCTAHVFGLEHAGVNYGLVFSNTIFSSLLGAFCIRNIRIYLGWFGLHGFLCAVSGLSFLITIFF